ncbi:DUF2058 family protein [Candidatus Electrothrix sp.]|uniref:DUF2058 family protein n=1 Tax=Candidatus Electrothrix sp. TaxID=2170559 RepID=UPI0040567A05
MGNPLQDQLLKAGLVSKKQASKAKQEQYAQSKKKKKSKSSRKTGRKPISKAEVAQAAEVARNKELSRKQAEERKQHELQAQIKQLVMNNRLERDDNGQAYHFALGKKIHRIFVAEEMIDRLCQGQLGIVQLADSFEVVPAKVVRQVAERDKEAVVSLREPSEEDDDW